MPDILHDYDAIGFESEHCLVKYNIRNLTRLVTDVYLEQLHKDEPHNYPKEIKIFDYEHHLGHFFTNCVWDVENGILIKLSAEKKVVRGYIGFQPLTEEELD